MGVDFQIRRAADMNWRMPKAHFHDAYEILLSLSEGCNFFIDRATYQLKRGSLLFVSAGTLHHSFAGEGGFYQRYLLHFPPETLAGLSSAQTDLAAVFAGLNCCVELDETRMEQVIHLYECCLKYEGAGFGEDIRREIFFREILLNFCELLATRRFALPTRAAEGEKLAPLLCYIDEHIREPLALDKLAGKFFINKFYLCHLFKEATGFTVGEYINNRRVLQARPLLRQGYSVQKAAAAAGFGSAAHFIRVFGAICGQTPGQYAKEQKNNSAPAL